MKMKFMGEKMKYKGKDKKGRKIYLSSDEAWNKYAKLYFELLTGRKYD